jgi:hypothetical protein
MSEIERISMEIQILQIIKRRFGDRTEGKELCHKLTEKLASVLVKTIKEREQDD